MILVNFQFVSTNSPECLPLRAIRSFCIKTGREMAEEKGWKWGGTSRVSDEDYGGND